MTELLVTVDNALRFDDSQLSQEALQVLWEAVNVYDPDDLNAAPITLAARGDDGRLVLPRGFAHRLNSGLASFGYNVVWDDKRVSFPGDYFGYASGGDIMPREYQFRAIDEMYKAEQGILVAPPGAGKTTMTAFWLAEHRERTLIIVDKINLVNQWAERIEAAINEVPAIIGDSKWSEGPITITTRQTLWSRRAELDAKGWWSTWGAVVYDECHQMSGETARDLVQRFPAKYRIGLSATPDRHSWMWLLGRAIIGEVFCEISDKELEDEGVLIRPRVVAVKTNFEFPWDRSKRGDTQWQRLVKKIKFDDGRNKLIAGILANQRGHCMLVSTDQLSHADEIAAMAYAAGWPMDRVMLFTSRQDAEERARMLRIAEEGDCVIISTIGKEALDIPRLDRYMLAWPTKGEAMLIQMVGRLRRTHAEKNEPPILYDLWDHNVAPLTKHFNVRRGVYDREGLELQVL